MTVRELIEVLSKHDPDCRVVTTWESTIHDLDDDEVYLSADGDVVIDADANSYKEQAMTTKGWTNPTPEYP